MDSRLKASLKIDLKSFLKYLGCFILGLLLVKLIIPGGFSLASGHGLWLSKNDVSSIPELILLLSTVFIGINFDLAFKSKIQNSFSRTQLFKNDMLLIVALSVVIAFLNRVFNFSLIDDTFNSYNGFFSIGFLNVITIFIISILYGYFLLSIGEFLGAFFNLFSKKIRKWIVILFFVGWVMVTVALFSITAIGIEIFVANHSIDSDTIDNVLTAIFNLLFGYRRDAPSNPINLIITLLVLNGILTLLIRFIIRHLQLHRN